GAEAGRWTSGRHADVVVQELGRDVLVIRPDERVELGIDAKLAKERQVSERSEGISVQLGSKVNLTGSAVAKAQPDGVGAHIAGLDDVVIHVCDSSGAMRRSGAPMRARCQFSQRSDRCRVAHSRK